MYKKKYDNLKMSFPVNQIDKVVMDLPSSVFQNMG